MKKIAILGSTGSIGRQALEIIASMQESFAGSIEVKALAAGAGNLDLLCEQIRLFSPELVSLPDDKSARQLMEILAAKAGTFTGKPEIVYGQAGLVACATHRDVDTVLTAVVGMLGLVPTACAIKQGKTIALANKETLVAGGSVIMPMVKQFGATIVPVDSEHSAIFQSMHGFSTKDIRQIWLTGSGGPFRTKTREEMEDAPPEAALKHPNWSMGRKITIDSATMMNKGLEIIEARWLFDIEESRIRVVVHPQSILHSAVEFVDGSIVGQMGVPDMRLPIHLALNWPRRVVQEKVPKLDLTKLATLTFEEPDFKRFPCLRLAKQVAAQDDSSACVLNAANEILVEAYLEKKIRFGEIAHFIEAVLDKHKPETNASLDDLIQIDLWARSSARELIGDSKLALAR